MNIFYLDENPKLAAQYHCDKHVIKMILEYSQLLSTAHNILDGQNDSLYKTTHANHPSSLWVRESRSHYMWLVECLDELYKVWKYRYNHPESKEHKSFKIFHILKNPPNNLVDNGFTPPPKVLKDDSLLIDNVVEAYRHCYKTVKSSFTTWKKDRPVWA